MTTARTATVCRWAMLLATVFSTSGAWAQPSDDPTEPTAIEHHQRGNELFDQQRFAEAADAFGQAYALEPLPKYLFNRSLAQARAGDCGPADAGFIELLRKGELPDEVRAASQEASEQCAEQKAHPPPPPAPAPVAPTPPLDADPEPPPEPAFVDEGVAPWYADPAGGVFFAIGLTTAVVGGVFVGLAASNDADLRDESLAATRNYDEHVALSDEVGVQGKLGVGLLIGGSLILLGGVVRYIVVGTADEAPTELGVLTHSW
jgi:hypothetical protein